MLNFFPDHTIKKRKKNQFLQFSSSPYRAVQALLNGARQQEQVNVARFQDLMKNVQNVPGVSQSNGYIPVPVPVSQKSEDPVESLMRKMFLRKVMNKFFDKNDKSEEDDDDFFGTDDDKFVELLFQTQKSQQSTRGRYVSLIKIAIPLK